MPMQLYLYNYENADNIEEVLSWRPTEKQWWITGFNPDYVGNVDASKEILIGCVDFSQFANANGENDMYTAFKDNVYQSKNMQLKEYTIFDDDNSIIWIIWYNGDLV